MTTTIQISDEMWEFLNKQKKKGESFQDILNKIIKFYLRKNNLNKMHNM